MKTANSQSVKIINTRLVLEQLIEHHETTRIEIARHTTLNKATVSSIISELIDRQFVLPTSKSVKTAGRSANVLVLNKNAGRIFSIELLHKSIYAVITNLYGEVVYETTKTVDNPEFNAYMKDLFSIIDELNHQTFDSVYGIIGIGVGVYGILSKDKKIKFTTFNSWRDIDLKSMIEEHTGIKTYIENEANISALGERIVYPNDEHIVSLNIGAGVGTGIIINNALYTGNDGYAGEFGHTIVVPHGKHCVCGNDGCLERYIANDAVIERYFELANETVTIDILVERFNQGNTYAIQVYDEFINYLSIAINNLSQTLNPKVIVINSQIVDMIPESIDLIKKNLHSKIMNLDLLTTSTFKTKRNVLGLTHLLIQEFFKIDKYTPKLSKRH